MKIYSNIFDVAQLNDRKFYVPQNSQFIFGVKFTKNGEDYNGGTIVVDDNGVTLSAEADTYAGYTCYRQTSSSPAQKIYDVTYNKNGVASKFKLYCVVTDKSVFEIDNEGVLELPIATSSTLGAVKVGSGLVVASDGTLSANQYTLPVASPATLGGVKIDGNGLTITTDGVLSATGGGSIPTNLTCDNVTTNNMYSANQFSGGLKTGTQYYSMGTEIGTPSVGYGCVACSQLSVYNGNYNINSVDLTTILDNNAKFSGDQLTIGSLKPTNILYPNAIDLTSIYDFLSKYQYGNSLSGIEYFYTSYPTTSLTNYVALTSLIDLQNSIYTTNPSTHALETNIKVGSVTLTGTIELTGTYTDDTSFGFTIYGNQNW